MSLDKSSPIFNKGATLALTLSFFLCTLRVFADDQLYSDLPLTNTANAESTAIQTTVARLSDLLNLKESVSEDLSSGADIQEAGSEGQSGPSEFTKRIFCNGFTGCGGRFRGRRRMPDPEPERLSLSKRPFCNSYGCYNSGRKRFSHSSPKIKIESPQAPGQKIMTYTDSLPWARIKKLFCNAYGGCQNMGKRLELLSPDVNNVISSGQRSPPPFSQVLDSAGGKKRVMTSDFDQDMDNLIDRMGR